MADLRAFGPQDPTRIDIHNAIELQWWSVKLGVTPEILCAAVEEHGPDPEEIRKKLHAAARAAFTKMGED